MLVAILFVSVSSISACDINDDAGTNATMLGSINALSDFHDIADLDFDDYSTLKNSTTSTSDGSTYEGSIVPHSSNMDDLVVIDNSNSENNIKKVDSLINVTDIVQSGQYKIEQTSNNTYTLILSDNTTLKLGVLQVFDLDSFKKVANSVSTDDSQFDAIVIDFKNNLDLKFSAWSEELIKLDHVKNLIIRGNGATVAAYLNIWDDYHFANVNIGSNLWLDNITLCGFNTAILNHGTCQITNSVLKENRVDITCDGDGGAVRNWGILKCSNSSFLDNYAKYAGAVYNEKGSQSTFVDCFFKGNMCYSKTGSCLETHDGINIYTSSGATCLVLNHNDVIQWINIATDDDYQNFLDNMDKIGHVKFLVLNFTSARFFSSNSRAMCLPSVENIYIYGNGATISVKSFADSEEYKFIKILQGQFCSIDGLTLTRFNTAILNMGSLSIAHSHFNTNRIDYAVCKDYGGAIYNDGGLVTISDSIFKGNYAKYGGAIYNDHGIISIKGSDFTSNTAYGDGGAIYNNVGFLYVNNCNFTRNNAKNGGSLFNHYAIMMLNNILFNKSTATDGGGAIYNDFGQMALDNCTFIDSQADEGKEILNYGEDAKYAITGDSYVLHDGVLTDTISVTSDAPNEVVRWVIRGVEVLACVAIVLVCAYYVPTAVGGVICFVGGALLAGAEEVIEGVYMDHNFNVYNCLFMMIVAGLLDAIAGVATTRIGHTCFGVVKGAVTKGSQALFNAIGFGLDLVGEVITEVIPRPDFSNPDVPTTILDLNNLKING